MPVLIKIKPSRNGTWLNKYFISIRVIANIELLSRMYFKAGVNFMFFKPVFNDFNDNKKPPTMNKIKAIISFVLSLSPKKMNDKIKTRSGVRLPKGITLEASSHERALKYGIKFKRKNTPRGCRYFNYTTTRGIRWSSNRAPSLFNSLH